MKIFVVIDTDLGWDSIVTAYTDKDDADRLVDERGSTSRVIDVVVDDPDYVGGSFVG